MPVSVTNSRPSTMPSIAAPLKIVNSSGSRLRGARGRFSNRRGKPDDYPAQEGGDLGGSRTERRGRGTLDGHVKSLQDG